MAQKRSRSVAWSKSLVLCTMTLVAWLGSSGCFAFMPPSGRRFDTLTTSSIPVYSRKATKLFALPEIDSMKAGEMRKELESYGVSTKSFFEKNEFAEALKKARSEGKTPKKETKTATGTKMSREERIKEEMEKANKLKVSELRKELKNLGISTKSFFEKYEFVKALAEARVDGVSGKAGGRPQEEEYDASYRDVVMQKYRANPRDFAGRPVIDIRLR